MELLVVGAAVTSFVGAWFMATDVYNDGVQSKRPLEQFKDYDDRFQMQSRSRTRDDNGYQIYEFWTTVDKGIPSSYDFFMRNTEDGRKCSAESPLRYQPQGKEEVSLARVRHHYSPRSSRIV